MVANYFKMSNSNFEPMPFRRKFGSDKGEGPSRTLSDLAGTASLPDPDSYVGMLIDRDTNKEIIIII